MTCYVIDAEAIRQERRGGLQRGVLEHSHQHEVPRAQSVGQEHVPGLLNPHSLVTQ